VPSVCGACVTYVVCELNHFCTRIGLLKKKMRRERDTVRVSVCWPARGGVYFMGASDLLPDHRDHFPVYVLGVPFNGKLMDRIYIERDAVCGSAG
jgi:hypothetical protein